MAATTSETALLMAAFLAPPMAPMDSSSPYAAGASVPPKHTGVPERRVTMTYCSGLPTEAATAADRALIASDSATGSGGTVCVDGGGVVVGGACVRDGGVGRGGWMDGWMDGERK